MGKEHIGALFDFNGVMIDDYQIQKESWTQIATELRGYKVTDEEMLNQIRGLPTIQTVRRMAEGKNLTAEEVLQFVQRKDSVVQDLFRNSPLARLSAGLTEFLDSLETHKIPKTIVSSSPLINMQIVFDRFKLFKWFDIQNIIHKDSQLNGHPIKNKPEPDPYLAGAETIKLEPQYCVVFEDAKSGIESAKKAGIQMIVAVNANPSHLLALSTIPGVIKSISDFTQISVDTLYNNL